MSLKKQKFHPKFLLEESNRGLLLDITIFFVNIFLMRTMMQRFAQLLQAANDGEAFAQATLFLIVVGLFVLPPLGATLKRWHFHQRLRVGKSGPPREENALSGCLFNPILYFCLNAVLFAAINAYILQMVFGRSEPDAAVFVSSIFFGIGLIIANTYLVYRYFTPPKKEPRARILREPKFEVLGDIAIFSNMLIFQLFWNLLSYADIGRVGSVGEFIGRLLVFGFLALLIYFPPRIFYLAEDISKRRTWVMILLANLPIIYRFVIGNGSQLDW